MVDHSFVLQAFLFAFVCAVKRGEIDDVDGVDNTSGEERDTKAFARNVLSSFCERTAASAIDDAVARERELNARTMLNSRWITCWQMIVLKWGSEAAAARKQKSNMRADRGQLTLTGSDR
mmetsp:Transcript_35622/g.85958  ORF Transcript_35622/g.85958 Transcript_35622/m.85958 type:complete len:120 (+) Transcript_35622:1753-2112(+)